ncbi:hypothetical protein JOF41_007317 [Saccharothrix coeruleofusca]|uniref:hypothetical protein n=1 Tax=Saccharothrix coeruleofusca TaxID=33919 RepID=UPI001AE2B4D9|nr:hypothetical protein [Saccharothrix coeruleofusca]MBP2341063.1 hypothetical protein [Saccharothrix coeruleofusca]
MTTTTTTSVYFEQIHDDGATGVIGTAKVPTGTPSTMLLNARCQLAELLREKFFAQPGRFRYTVGAPGAYESRVESWDGHTLVWCEHVSGEGYCGGFGCAGGTDPDPLPTLVRADDALLTRLGGRDSARPELGDDALAELLLAWRREIDARPVGELLDTDTALALVSPEEDTGGLGVFRGIAVGLLLTAALVLLVALGWWAW